MRSWPYYLFVNFILAVGIVLSAVLGRSMGIQGPALAISVVWPATGLSLAGLMIFGNRAGLGVFLGNLAYNLFYLNAFPPSMSFLPVYAIIASVVISMGSFVQAFLSAYIMRTYTHSGYFRSVHDIFIFLIPASFLPCLIGSTVGVASLYFAGELESQLILPIWLTFWLGDTVGIYVVTPLLVIWTIQRFVGRAISHVFSIFCMVSLFLLLSYLTYRYSYPLAHLFVPISIWAAYLFRMHGASLAIFLMTAASIAFAAGQGYEGTSLIFLITFIAVTVAASLIIAAVVNEREEAWALLDSRNVYLEQEVEVKSDIIHLSRSASDQKRKLVSQGIEAKRLSQVMQDGLNTIELSTKDTQDSIQAVTELSSEAKPLVMKKLLHIQKNLSKILQLDETLKELLERFRSGN
ncbi:MAG: MASE1 domain-containing protein [Parachlamydiaceae bacterium]